MKRNQRFALTILFVACQRSSSFAPKLGDGWSSTSTSQQAIARNIPPPAKPPALSQQQAHQKKSLNLEKAAEITAAVLGSGVIVTTGRNKVKKMKRDQDIVIPRRKTLKELQASRKDRLDRLDSSLQSIQEEFHSQSDIAPATEPSPGYVSMDQDLSAKYAAIDDVGERAYQILLDLNMVEEHRVMDVTLASELMKDLEHEVLGEEDDEV